MEDERLARINREKQNALNQSNNMYNDLLTDNKNLYNQQNNYANQYEKTQNEILDKQLAFNQQQIDRQKEIARQTKEVEDKKALNDYTSFVNPYGVNAEAQASQGLLNSGLSETTKLGGWNTYQNRLATANKAMQDAFIQYDNDMNEARLNNDVQKAQNAVAKLQMQLEYSQNYFSNKSTISQNQLSNNQSLNDNYYNRYQTEYNNIQNEKAQAEAVRQWEAEMAEKQRQYNEQMAFQREQARIQQQQWEREYALSKARQASQNSSSRNLTNGASQGNGIKIEDTSNNEQNNIPIADNTQYEAVYSPRLSSDRAQDWHYGVLGTSKFTKNELLEKLAQGKSQGILNDDDITKIMEAYGVR